MLSVIGLPKRMIVPYIIELSQIATQKRLTLLKIEANRIKFCENGKLEKVFEIAEHTSKEVVEKFKVFEIDV